MPNPLFDLDQPAASNYRETSADTEANLEMMMMMAMLMLMTMTMTHHIDKDWQDKRYKSIPSHLPPLQQTEPGDDKPLKEEPT